MKAHASEIDSGLNSKDNLWPLRVVIAYNDVAAGKRAMSLLADLGKELKDDVEFRPLPWSFDLLSDLDWGQVAATDAVNADILILATSSANPLPPAVGRWAEAAIDRKQGTEAAVVALFEADGANSSRLRAIQAAARRAGLEFFAPTPADELDRTIERIRRRAETITPLLEEILHHQLSSHRAFSHDSNGREAGPA